MKANVIGMLGAVRALLGASLVVVAQTLYADVGLVPVVADGLSNPVFVTSAHDGSRRLFIVELQGVIRVLQPGATSSSVFVDIRSNVVSGGEQGLLGLAFHPQYATNGRFFVFYTRASDGALVIAEHSVSANANVADPDETVLLAIPHPVNRNHNGGMLAFGRDGYLYIGVGDGGAGNDPPNNAQNVDSLLGKILRIDVDRPDAGLGTRYSAPPDNPFVDRAGRDEIFALGLRNPWRFSFDRATGASWVADVGQNAREEVNAPILNGGNYGWRVFEGTRCTNNDAGLCNPSTFVAPLFEYVNGAGRCSITGGYVYRGALGTLPHGTYIYADYCSGEIFAWDGAAQSLLLDTTLSISSFGEDEQGELYVVDLGGGVHRIVSGAPTAIEYQHTGFGHYFVTSLPGEIVKLDAGVFAGWSRTGQSFPVHAAGAPEAVGACRFFSERFAPKSSHFYTPLAAECDAVRLNPDWLFEGETFALAPADSSGACASGLQPLYRLYNNGLGGAPNHRYTTSLTIRGAMIDIGWSSEGYGALGVIGCVPE